MDVFGWEWEVDNILIRTCYREVPAILQTSLSCQLICSAATKEFARILDTGNKHQRAQGHVPIWTGLKKMSSRKLLPFHPSQVCFQTFGNQKCNQPYWEKKRVKVGLYGLVSFKILKVSVEAGEELIMRIGFLNILQTLQRREEVGQREMSKGCQNWHILLYKVAFTPPPTLSCSICYQLLVLNWANRWLL